MISGDGMAQCGLSDCLRDAQSDFMKEISGAQLTLGATLKASGDISPQSQFPLYVGS